MIELLKTETHCHNMFSNGHVGEIESPFDSNVTISSQLEESLLAGLDVLFVTNHNTLDGYNQIINYKNSHKKFSGIEVYPAEEVTTDKEAHVLVYGLHKEIKSYLIGIYSKVNRSMSYHAELLMTRYVIIQNILSGMVIDIVD